MATRKRFEDSGIYNPNSAGEPTRSSDFELGRVSLAVITNFAAPYRRPVWNHINSATDLSIYILEKDHGFENNASNRGAEWMGASSESAFPITEIPTWKFSRGEVSLYLAKGKLPFTHCDAVIIGGWESPVYWQALFTAKRRRIPAIGFYESTSKTNAFPTGPIAFARRRFFNLLDAVVVPGVASLAAVRGMGVHLDKIHVGFNAVDGRAIYNSAQRARSESSENVDHDEGHHFIYVGQLIGRKNIFALIEAFASIRAPKDRLTIVGKGDEREALEKHTALLCMSDCVTFTGAVHYEDIGATLAQAHTLVLPSRTEVWGLVVNEALAAGIQAVVSDSCGVADSVQGMPGVFITDTSIGAIAESLEAARENWRGTILEPAILKYSPEAFGDVFVKAVQESLRLSMRAHTN